jgi:hypothetical protein
MTEKLGNMGTGGKWAVACGARVFLHSDTLRIAASLVILAWCALFSATAKASCDRRANARAAITSPETRSFQTFGLLLHSQGNSEDEDDNSSIVGLWHIKFLSGGQVFDEGFDQFHSDGTEILNDTAPPQPANGAGTVCLGVFKKTGPRTYKLKHPFWSFDANGILVGTGVFLEQIIVDKDGKSFSGSFSFFTYDLNGAVTSQVTGELTAERITAD